MNLLKLITTVVIAIALLSCGDKTTPVKKDQVDGVIQKGPFINGSTVSIAELDGELNPTGRKFDSQIINNSGLFTIKNIELESQYVELKADGFYFNEVHGVKSASQLTLYSLSDLSKKDTVNVNILSHLERGRMLYLLEKGSNFNEAKYKARTEVLSIFGIAPDEDVDEFDDLDISKAGESNAILLAASVILQGNRDTAGLSELLADISTDIRTDGILDSASTISKIVTQAEVLNLENVRTNLDKRYKELGVEFIIPEFEKYVNLFLKAYEYHILQFPEEGKHGKNLLYYLVNSEDFDEMIDDGCFYVKSGSYSIAAEIPDEKEIHFFAGSENAGAMRTDEESIEGWVDGEDHPEYSYAVSLKNSQMNADMKLELLGSETFLRMTVFDKKSGEMIREYGYNFRVNDDSEQNDDLNPEEVPEENDDNEEQVDEQSDNDTEPTPTSVNFPENGSHGKNLMKILYGNTPGSTIELEEGIYSLYVESPFDKDNMTQNELMQSAVSITFQGSAEQLIYHPDNSFGWYYKLESENVQYFSINKMYNDAKIEYKGGNYQVSLMKSMSTMQYSLISSN